MMIVYQLDFLLSRCDFSIAKLVFFDHGLVSRIIVHSLNQFRTAPHSLLIYSAPHSCNKE
jgi:hypothetical protein